MLCRMFCLRRVVPASDVNSQSVPKASNRILNFLKLRKVARCDLLCRHRVDALS